MDKLKERHSHIKTDVYGELHANITKEIACGFKNWWGELSNREKTNLILNHTEHGTDEELFDLYLKSL